MAFDLNVPILDLNEPLLEDIDGMTGLRRRSEIPENQVIANHPYTPAAQYYNLHEEWQIQLSLERDEHIIMICKGRNQ